LGILSTHQLLGIKTARERMYDTDVSAVTITSSPDAGDIYGRTTTPTTSTTVFQGRLSYDRNYIYSYREGGTVMDSDLVITTSMDNLTTVTQNKTYILVGSNKYTIASIERYPDFNEILIRCNKGG